MDNNLNIITSHLKGKPSEADIQAAASDEALREEILFARQMQFAQEYKEEIRVQNILKGILNDAPIEPDDELTEELAEEGVLELPTQTGSTGKLWLWGIGSVIAIFLIYFINISLEKAATHQFVWQQLTHLDSHWVCDETTDSDICRAIRPYDSKDYKSAISYFDTYIQINPNDKKAKLYLGISQIHANKYKKSLLTLQSLISTADNDYISKHIDWYMGIALLMDNQTEAATSHFNKISKDNPHYTSAEKLLKQIKNH